MPIIVPDWLVAGLGENGVMTDLMSYGKVSILAVSFAVAIAVSVLKKLNLQSSINTYCVYLKLSNLR